MNTQGLLNAPLSHIIATLSPVEYLTLINAQLAVPSSPVPEQIDLSVSPGIPNLMHVVRAIAEEMPINKVIVTQSFAQDAHPLYQELVSFLQQLSEQQHHTVDFVQVSDEEFRQMAKMSRAIVRTGESVPFANVIVQSTLSH